MSRVELFIYMLVAVTAVILVQTAPPILLAAVAVGLLSVGYLLDNLDAIASSAALALSAAAGGAAGIAYSVGNASCAALVTLSVGFAYSTLVAKHSASLLERYMEADGHVAPAQARP